MLNFLQTTETDTPAVLDLTRDICIDPPAVALDVTSDNSLPTVSCLESCTSVTTLPFMGTSPTPVGIIDPAKLVKLKLSTPEKEYIIKNGPNQPDKSVLTCTSTTRQPHFRHCSPKCFTMPMVPKDSGYHIHHALFCVPCILFSDAVLRGQHFWPNQGIAGLFSFVAKAT